MPPHGAMAHATIPPCNHVAYMQEERAARRSARKEAQAKLKAARVLRVALSRSLGGERLGDVPDRVGVLRREGGEAGERSVDLAVVDLVHVLAPPDPRRQRGAQQPVAVHDNLVPRLLVGCGRDARDGARQAKPPVQREERVRLRGGEEALRLGDQRGEERVDRHRLAVAEEERLVCLERAREGVTVVHRPQQRLLPQVGADALEHRVDRVLDHALRLGRAAEVCCDHLLAVGVE
mmetsp:Transcript_3586/g.10756  ORF Transcript_3586/g.10756 Transcript_3586/m.10756 type:complete len:235 (+) Transcript_3586:693-1397(+)